jgi:hypothetical protein
MAGARQFVVREASLGNQQIYDQIYAANVAGQKKIQPPTHNPVPGGAG